MPAIPAYAVANDPATPYYTESQPVSVLVYVDANSLYNWRMQQYLPVSDYKRLEVGSPGIDRPLRNENDFLRFLGHEVDITLKAPIGPTGTDIAANRKKFRGTLERPESGQGWQIVWSEAPERKPGARVSKKAKPLPVQVLGFTLDEIREARLAPVVNFKGRAAKPVDTDLNPTAAENGKAGE